MNLGVLFAELSFNFLKINIVHSVIFQIFAWFCIGQIHHQQPKG